MPRAWEAEVAAAVFGFTVWGVTKSATAGVAGALFGVLLFLRRYTGSLEERLARLETDRKLNDTH